MYKNILFTIVIISTLLFSSDLPAQSITSGDIYALVIGVSEYSDPKISPLNYAHKDANEFANYLMSEAGGNVPAENIKLLTNQDATVSKIYNAKKWLEETPKKKDLVFFYFAGHGDVESSLYKLGFLLAYDTPHKNYLNNAIRIEDFNIMANTLSVEKEIDVILITDACHSGKLAGSDNRGRMLIGEQLSRVQKNEIRIASCEADQLAQEDMVWGGGRGAFSYHLVNGLKGLADGPDEKDGVVTLFELKNYLEKSVPKEVFEETGEDQIPVIEGRPFSRMAIVHKPTLELLTGNLHGPGDQGNSNPTTRSIDLLPTFADTFFHRITDYNLDTDIDFHKLAKHPNSLNDGIESNTIDREEAPIPADQIAGVQDQIIKAFVEKFSMPDDNIGPDEWLDKLSKPSRERTEFQRNIAARIHDYIQGAINRYLAGDNEEMDKRQYRNQSYLPYEKYPDMLTTAMRLIDTSNHLYHIMKVKKHYFQGVNYRLGFLSPNRTDGVDYIKNAIHHQHKAIQLDSNAAYVQNELGILSKWQKQYDKSESYFRKACALVPTWSIPRSNLSSLYYSQNEFEKGLEEGLTSLSIQSDYANGHINTGRNAMKMDNLLIAKEAFIKASKLDENNFSPFLNLGALYTATTDYSAAETNFRTAVALLQEFPMTVPLMDFEDFDSDGVISLLDQDAVDAFTSFELNPNKFKENDHISHFIYALEKYRDGNFILAEKHFRITVTIREDHPLASYYLGKISSNRNDWKVADAYFEKAYQNHIPNYRLANFYDEDEIPAAVERREEFLPFFESAYVEKDLIHYLRAKVLKAWGYYVKSENIYLQLIPSYSNLFFLRSELWDIYKQLGYHDKRESTIIESKSVDKAKSNHALNEFYKEQIEKGIDTKANTYKLANHYYYQFLDDGQISFDIDKNTEIRSSDNNPVALSNEDEFDPVPIAPIFAPNVGENVFGGPKSLINYKGYKEIIAIPISLFETGPIAIKMYKDLMNYQDSTGKGELMYRIGDLYVAMNDHKKALESYEIANTYNNEKHPSIRVKSIYLNEGFDNYTNSYNSLNILHGDSLLSTNLYSLYGYYLALNKENYKAERVIKEALKMTPFDNEKLRNHLGIALLRQKKWKQAEEVYKDLSEENPENYDYLYTLARIYAQSGKEGKAFKYLEKGFEQNMKYDYVLASDPLLDPLRTKSKWKDKVLSHIKGEFDLLFR